MVENAQGKSISQPDPAPNPRAMLAPDWRLDEEFRFRDNSSMSTGETRAADSVTIMWMLSVLTAFSCEVVAAVARLLGRWFETVELLPVLAGFMLFGALIAATASVVLLPVVWKLRRVPPPIGVLAFAALVVMVAWSAALFPFKT